MNRSKQIIRTPHTIGIQNPGRLELAKPMEIDITDRKMRYRAARESKNMRTRWTSLLII